MTLEERGAVILEMVAVEISEQVAIETLAPLALEIQVALEPAAVTEVMVALWLDFESPPYPEPSVCLPTVPAPLLPLSHYLYGNMGSGEQECV